VVDTPVVIESTGARLSGDLLGPDGAVASVVMIGGSGSADRTNDGYFRAYRSVFAAHRIGVLWYDKRGVGGSSGDFPPDDLDDLATDALAALDAAASAVGSAIPIGLFGHSEGGWVALRAASRSERIGFVVTNSTPGVSPGRQDRHAIDQAQGAARVPAGDQAELLELYDALLAAAARDATLAEARLLMAASPAAARLSEYIGEFDERGWTFWRRKAHHDPLIDHRSIRCPHLAVFGAADPLIPVADSISAFGGTACDPNRPGRATVTFHVLPGANHRLIVGRRSEPSSDHLAMLARWIRDSV
jgi:pimeloyl-ACP methyl ester carboxylesterase